MARVQGDVSRHDPPLPVPVPRSSFVMPVSGGFRSRREGKRGLRTFCGFARRPTAKGRASAAGSRESRGPRLGAFAGRVPPPFPVRFTPEARLPLVAETWSSCTGGVVLHAPDLDFPAETPNCGITTALPFQPWASRCPLEKQGITYPWSRMWVRSIATQSLSGTVTCQTVPSSFTCGRQPRLVLRARRRARRGFFPACPAWPASVAARHLSAMVLPTSDVMDPTLLPPR